MKRRVIVVLLLSFVVAMCASYVVFRAVASRPATGAPRPTHEVVVATRTLEVGTLIAPADIHVEKRVALPPKGAALKAEDALNRGVVAAVYDGEVVMMNRLGPKGSGGGLAALIPMGMRVCAVKVNDVVGVAGFVVPGMRVDVLVTGMPPSGNPTEGARVRTILQNIQVLSADTNIQRDAAGKPQPAQVVNLLVTPEQAERLSLASNETRIQLVLRNPADTETARPAGAALSELLGGPPAPPPAIPPKPAEAVRALPEPPPAPVVEVPQAPVVPQVHRVEVLNGSGRSEAVFARPGSSR